MNFKEVMRLVVKPRHQMELEENERYEKSQAPIKEHLRKLELAAIRHVQDSTDEAAEFPNAKRS